MKNEIGAIILAIWIIVCIGGLLLWNCKADMFQGIGLGLVITAVALKVTGSGGWANN